MIKNTRLQKNLMLLKLVQAIEILSPKYGMTVLNFKHGL